MSDTIPQLPLYVFMVCTCSTFIKSKWMANSLAWFRLWGWNAYCEYQTGKKHNISNHNVTFFWMFSVSHRIINIWDRHASHYAAMQDDVMPSGSLLSLLWGLWVAESMHICAFVCVGYRIVVRIVSSREHAHMCFCVCRIQTTVFTSLQARLCIIADPLSWRTALSERREFTATLVVHRILLIIVLQYCHSDI